MIANTKRNKNENSELTNKKKVKQKRKINMEIVEETTGRKELKQA